MVTEEGSQKTTEVGLQLTIHRHTVIGWNYTILVKDNEFILPNSPRHKGTIEDVLTFIVNDETFQKIQKADVKYQMVWFVRYEEKWRRLSSESEVPFSFYIPRKEELQVILE